MTDLHVGSKDSSDQRIFQAFEVFAREGVNFITCSGDVTEGMSNRAGHIYELSEIGFDAQKEEAIRIFEQWTDTDIFSISGNHDEWFMKSNGAMIVKDIDKELVNFHFLGYDEGDISLMGRATVKLWHGNDGAAYALSYRLQKILESLSGGTKPNVILAGHDHKSIYIFERNVHAFGVGCMQAQTRWMRSKRLAAHVGFWVIELWVGKRGIASIRSQFFPFYA